MDPRAIKIDKKYHSVSADGYFFYDTVPIASWGDDKVSKNYKGIAVFATNEEHIEYLEDYVKATVRVEHCGMHTKSLHGKLPYIYRSPRYRKDMLRILNDLRIELFKKKLSFERKAYSKEEIKKIVVKQRFNRELLAHA